MACNWNAAGRRKRLQMIIRATEERRLSSLVEGYDSEPAMSPQAANRAPRALGVRVVCRGHPGGALPGPSADTCAPSVPAWRTGESEPSANRSGEDHVPGFG